MNAATMTAIDLDTWVDPRPTPDVIMRGPVVSGPGYDHGRWQQNMVETLTNADRARTAPRPFWRVGVDTDGTTYIY